MKYRGIAFCYSIKSVDHMWDKIRKPFAAALGVTIGGVCALVAAEQNLVTIDPSSIVFVTVLLVDMSSNEAFYITATFRVLGTFAGLLVGAGISFVTNAIVQHGEVGWGLNSFRLGCMALIVFTSFYIEINYPKYGYVSIIFVYTASALIFSGTTNAVTVATIAAVVGGCLIATCVMWTFNYNSAEKTLLKSHLKLVLSVLDMVKWSVRANKRYREDYFKFLDETKTAFDTNADCIANYVRWMRWTRRKPAFDFVSLTHALRPLYNQTAAFFWASCRDRLVSTSVEEYLDAGYLFCLTSDHYFEFFHAFVTELVEAVESMQAKFEQIYRQHPDRLLGRIERIKDKITRDKSTKKAEEIEKATSAHLLASVLRNDMIAVLRAVIRMKYRYAAQKSVVHPNFSQQWLFSDFIYQITLMVFDILEYLRAAIDTVVVDASLRARLHRKLRFLLIKAEVIGNGAFLQAKSFDTATENLDDVALRLVSQSTEEDLDSIPSSNSANELEDA
jgi:hypothetical protein